MMKRIERIIFWLFFIGSLVGISISIYTYFLGEAIVAPDDVKITNFGVCDNLDPREYKIIQEISRFKAYIYICGYLETPAPVQLSIYLYKEPENEFLYSNPVDEKFKDGFFYELIEFTRMPEKGQYRIDVYYFRNVIAKISFKVK